MESLILVQPEQPENTGFVARLCSNFDCSLRLVDPQFNLEKTRKTANNAQEVLRNAEIFDSLEEAIQGLDFVVGTKPGKGVNSKEFKFRENTSIVLGRESSGLSNIELDLCDAVVHIPVKGYSSLNLSHAAAVLMYEASSGSDKNADSERLKVVAQRTGEKVRELIARGSPTREELDQVLGEL